MTTKPKLNAKYFIAIDWPKNRFSSKLPGIRVSWHKVNPLTSHNGFVAFEMSLEALQYKHKIQLYEERNSKCQCEVSFLFFFFSFEIFLFSEWYTLNNFHFTGVTIKLTISNTQIAIFFHSRCSSKPIGWRQDESRSTNWFNLQKKVHNGLLFRSFAHPVRITFNSVPR